MGQQRELTRREIDLVFAAAHAFHGRLDDQVAAFQGDGSRNAAAPQHRLQARGEHHRRERLDHIVVGTQLEGIGLVVFAVLGAQHDDGRAIVLRPHAFEDLVTRQARQHDVEHQHVVLTELRKGQTGVTVVRDVDDPALGAQQGSEILREIALVVDDQQAHGVTSQGPLSAADIRSKHSPTEGLSSCSTLSPDSPSTSSSSTPSS